jgi:hypothetical protein
MNPPMTPPMTPIDRDIADAFAALDRTAPGQAPEEFTSRVMARIGDGEGAAPRAGVGRESPPGPREDSGLHDIVALASRAKQRLSERDQSESDAGESVMLAAAPGGLRAVALPDPSRAARPSASAPPREPTRTDARSSLPFWALGSVATLAAAAAVAVFVFGIGRGSDRSADAPAESAPSGAVAQLDRPARAPAAAAGQAAPAAGQAAPAPADGPPALAAAVEAERRVATAEEARPKESDRRARRERAETGADTARKSENRRPESAAEGVEGGGDVAAPAVGGGPSSAPGGAPGAGGEPDDQAGGEANLEDMLDAVTDEKKPGAAPPREAPPEPPPAAQKNELDRRAVSAALESIRDEVKRCHEVESFAGSVTVKFVIAPSGQVSKAAAIGSHIRTKTGTCVARAVLKASFPAFEGTPISITYPFLLAR